MKNLIIVFLLAFIFSGNCFSQKIQNLYSEDPCEETLYKDLHDLFSNASFVKFDKGHYLETDRLIVEINKDKKGLISYEVNSIRGKSENIEIFQDVFEVYLSKNSFKCRPEEKQFILIHYINHYDSFKFEEEDFDSIIKEIKTKGFIWKKMLFIASSTKRN